MDREMIVLEMDVKDRASYGFMAMPTPDQYAKKVNQMMIIKKDRCNASVFYSFNQ